MTKKQLARFFRRSLLMLAGFLLIATTVFAQSTSFTYQGRLTDGGNPATNTYDMQFKLYDTQDVGTGAQQGDTLTNSNVQVTNGVFTIGLDFGACASCFDGTARYLEISIRPAGSAGPYTVLSPRQPVTSAPYAVRSLASITADGLSAGCVNCVTSSQIASVDGTQITGNIPVESVPVGSGNYIQNAATLSRQGKNGAQPAPRFNIEGDGVAGGMLSANTINAQTQFNLSGVRILSSAGTDNLFVGVAAGEMQALGIENSYFGKGAGMSNTDGSENSFFGRSAGRDNSTGGTNSFFGKHAGRESNGRNNSFFGAFAGALNLTGSFNTFVGELAGTVNREGNNNTAMGRFSNFGSSNLSFATAIGSQAVVTASNRVQIGRLFQDTVAIGLLASATSLHVCIDGNNGVFSNCSSSLRYKESIQPFTSGLSLLGRLRPVTFNWKGRVEPDLGLIAEEVAEVEPLLVTHNQKGEIEGVKYEQLNVVLINAIKEQQSQIQQQQQQIKEQQKQIDGLKRLLCGQNPQAEVCR
jgi:hypothetical protein